MFLLDTNILSAVMGSRPAPEVAKWMARQPPELLFTAAVCQAEILSGIAVLPKGRRRDGAGDGGAGDVPRGSRRPHPAVRYGSRG